MLIYNDVTYQTTAESMYTDIGIVAEDLHDAEILCITFEKMSDYIFDGDSYTNMVVSKRMIILTDNTVTVKVRLREKSELELAQEEIASLRQAMKELAQTTNKTTTAKINKILAEKG